MEYQFFFIFLFFFSFFLVDEVRLLPKDNIIEYFFMGFSNTWKWVPVVVFGNEMELVLESK